MDLAVDLLRCKEDADVVDEPVGSASWQERKIFLLDLFLASGKRRLGLCRAQSGSLSRG
jgi:hypothetical protein